MLDSSVGIGGRVVCEEGFLAVAAVRGTGEKAQGNGEVGGGSACQCVEGVTGDGVASHRD